MGFRDSLGGVSESLDKIIKQLREIEELQEKIGRGTSTFQRTMNTAAGSSTARSNPVASSVGVFSTPAATGSNQKGQTTPLGTFSTPPPPPGTHLRGVTNTTSGTSYMNVDDDPQRPGWARAVAMTGAAAATAAYEVTPGLDDVYPYQRLLFRAGFLSSGGYRHRRPGLPPDDPNYGVATQTRITAAFGNRMTDPYGALTSANILTMSGMGDGTAHFNTVMPQVANTSMLFNQSNATAAQAQGALYGGGMAGRLAQIGIFVSDLQTGDPIKFGKIIDQIWARAYGSATRKIPYESLMADLRGGFLGSWLRKTFAESPELYDQIYQALILKAEADGGRLDYSSLQGKGSEPGSQNAMDWAAQTRGMTVENDPALKRYELEGSRADNIQAYAQEILDAYRTGADLAITMNSLTQWLADTDNPLINFLINIKGFLESVSSIGELGGVAGFVTTVIGGALSPLFGLGRLLGFSDGGAIQGSGTSTSDSIPALLSRGEYVINARAAQKIGTDRLDALNAVGQDFGSGFASPTQHFSRGGIAEFGYTKHTLQQCIDGACAGDATLDGWSALAYGDPALKSYQVAGSSKKLIFLERDGIGDYLAAFASAWQSHPDLGGGRLDLSEGWSGGHALRPSAGSSGVSNHSAGVAMDLRPDLLPAFDGDRMDMTDAEVAATRSLLSRFNKLEWGGTWGGGMLDEMHFEIESPGAWGKGGHAPAGGDENQEDSEDAKDAEPGILTKAVSSVGALLFRSTTTPRVSGFRSMGSTSLGIGRGSTFSWISPPTAIAQVGEAVSKVTASTPDDEVTERSSDGASHPAPAKGSGPQWLYDFLVSKGLRGNDLRTVWVIGRRESGGNPNLIAAMSAGSWTYPDLPPNFNPEADGDSVPGSPGKFGRYDVGLFQINSQHVNKVKSMFGGDMLSMIDPDLNFEMLKTLSAGLKNWKPWGIAGVGDNGFSYVDWSTWGSSWASNWGPKTEANDAKYLGEFDNYNTHGYSEGAYRTHEGLAKLHEGEMVLPANVAERFREVMRGASTRSSHGSGEINITLKIERPSQEEAERFAKKITKYLEDGSWADSVRSR